MTVMTDFDWFKSGFDLEIQLMEEYVKGVEPLIQKELNDFKGKIDAEATKISDPTFKDDFYEFHSGDYSNLNEGFPNILNESALISIMAMFEKYLNFSCAFLAQKRQTKMELKDIQGKGVYRAKVYLSKVIGLNLETVNFYWDDLSLIGEIRNACVQI